MKRKKGNQDAWHQTMYDPFFAGETIGSKRYQAKAKKEVAFLLKILKLHKGSEILDVPCGTGRHSVLLARRGYYVVGVDINRYNLQTAGRQNRHRNVKYEWGNLIDLKKYGGKFDAVFNLFTSFGYFSTDQKNEKVLRQLIRALKPGGLLVMTLANRDWILKTFKPVTQLRLKSSILVGTSTYDHRKKQIESFHIIMDRNNRKSPLPAYYHRIRLYNKTEMVRLLRKTGLHKIRVYGDIDGSPFHRSRSHHPYYVAVKV